VPTPRAPNRPAAHLGVERCSPLTIFEVVHERAAQKPAMTWSTQPCRRLDESRLYHSAEQGDKKTSEWPAASAADQGLNCPRETHAVGTPKVSGVRPEASEIGPRDIGQRVAKPFRC